MTQGNVLGPQTTLTDGAADTGRRITKDNAGVIVELHGKYYEQASRNRVYIGSSAAAGIAIIVPATTGGHPTLWNPSDSGRDLSIIRLELGYVSGNNAPTAFEWASTGSTGSTSATAAPIATLTRVAPVSGRLGGLVDNKGVWSPTTNTFTAAPTFFRSAGLSLFTGVAATAAPPFPLTAVYDGDFVIAPGNAVSLCTVGATTTALFQVSITWEEIIIPN